MITSLDYMDVNWLHKHSHMQEISIRRMMEEAKEMTYNSFVCVCVCVWHNDECTWMRKGPNCVCVCVGSILTLSEILQAHTHKHDIGWRTWLATSSIIFPYACLLLCVCVCLFVNSWQVSLQANLCVCICKNKIRKLHTSEAMIFFVWTG
jgi:hypothetical protein